MMKKCLLIIGLILSQLSYTQLTEAEYREEFEKASFNELFDAGNNLMEDNFHIEAKRIWLYLLEKDSLNSNLNYKAGKSLYMLKEYDDAISHLQIATNKIKNGYIDYVPNFDFAPFETYYYLADCLHKAEKIDEAKKNYNLAIGTLKKNNPLIKKSELGLKQVEVAIKMMDNPIGYEIKNMSDVINSPYAEHSPVITLDGTSLFFTSNRLRKDSSNMRYLSPQTGGYFEDVYVSYIDRSGNWGEPKTLDFSRANRNEASITTSADGSIVYVYQDDDGDGNIYVSQVYDTTFSSLDKFQGEMNSKYWETHCTSTPDGSTIYFVSDRKGGMGGRDIWRITKLPNGEWSKALNLGAPINTDGDETAPFIGSDSKTLYFCANNEKSMGGFDIFVSKLEETGWTNPENMGYPLNTVGDDYFYTTTADGLTGYYASERHNEGYGESDIYQVTSPKSFIDGIAIFKGYIMTSDGTMIPDNLSITVTNNTTSTERHYKPRRRDGGYVLDLTPCNNYTITYFQGDKTFYSTEIDIDCNTAYQEIHKEILLDLIEITGSGEIIAKTGDPNAKISGEKFWMLKNLNLDAYKNVSVKIYDENNKFLFESIVNKFGQFKYKELGTDGKTLFQIVHDDDDLCNDLVLELYDEAGNLVSEIKQKDMCTFEFNFNKDVANNEDNTPKTFKEIGLKIYFGYNRNNVPSNDSKTSSFLSKLKSQIKAGRTVNITIIGNASKVPTKKYKSDTELAKLRAENMKNKINNALNGVDPSKYTITIETNVSGPEFSEEKKAARSEYYKHQFVEVLVK
jgi:hypothetical protein